MTWKKNQSNNNKRKGEPKRENKVEWNEWKSKI